MNSLSQRQQDILTALIEEYITLAEPVSSGIITGKYSIQASPATVRNEMARLEQLGYLHQPHASAGRIPTDRAYRFYVNSLMNRNIDIPREVKLFLEEFENFDAQIQRLLEYSSKKLADLTHYTSLILAPRLRKTMFKYLKMSSLEDNRLLIILMTNTGAIINKLIRLEHPMNQDILEKMTRILNHRLEGMFLGDIHMEFFSQFNENLPAEILSNLTLLTRETLLGDEDRFIYDGAVNLMELPEFQNLSKLKITMELLEEEKTVAEILKKTLDTQGLKVYIGKEHNLGPIEECSLITATYKLGNVSIGTVGVLGPTRMPYQRIIPVVRNFATIFSRKITAIANS
ncbi:MAG: heat-inducible transcriptional repressor HrcA [Vulcanimicrobiota bacterium]